MTKLIQYPNVKEYANNYLSEVGSLVRNLYVLKDDLTEVLFDVESKACQCHSLLDEDDTSLDTLKNTFKKLPSSYSKRFFFIEEIIINLIKRKTILSKHYKIYAAEMEVAYA